MSQLSHALRSSEVHRFAKEAHDARFPAFAWKAIICDMLGLPPGTRPTVAQLLTQPHSAVTLWLQLTLRFERMTTVRWAEYLECEEERIHNTLTYLGSTPDRIENNFALMGVMGSTLDSCDCPIAHFFRGVYGAWFVEVTQTQSFIDFVKCSNPGQTVVFIQEFDNDGRPSLNPFPYYADIL